MTKEAYQLEASAAAIYEQQKVKAIFGPLAFATLDSVSVFSGDTILDVACGTGVMARSVRERYGSSVRVSGADLSEGMIATAKALTLDDQCGFDWRIADAANLPFDDSSFSVVFCQQGIQFFPDDLAAVKEMRRVLVKNGRLFLSVWAGANDFFLAMAKALDLHISPEIGTQSLAPFAYDGPKRLPPILKKAGFGNVAMQTISVDRIIAEPEKDIPKEIMANPVGPAVRRAGVAIMEMVVAEIISGCKRFRQGSRLVIPQHAILFSAEAI